MGTTTRHDSVGRTAVDPPSAVRTTVTIGAGLLGGLALGVAARAWMRLISTDPEFSWNGTMFIVLGFTLWGTGQGIATAVRARAARPRVVSVARIVGGITTLPLFMAAGGIMFPTVVGGSLAMHRSDWAKWVRAVCAVVASLPVLMVGLQLHDEWGWGWRWFAGMAGLVALYATVVAAERATAAQHVAGWRMRSVVRTVAAVAGVAVVLVAGRGLG